mmetsp:Transcript_20676/g.57421  ORF Transcript_20676/g.57421 Transcript_20676/m.57421 type:complete len:471 (-) Transcript_20676:254-1666(-)
MISIPLLSSSLLLLALLFLSTGDVANGRSTSPWHPKSGRPMGGFPSMAAAATSPYAASVSASASSATTTTTTLPSMVQFLRGGDSSLGTSRSNTALPTPTSPRIAGGSTIGSNSSNNSSSSGSGSATDITGGHIKTAKSKAPDSESTSASESAVAATEFISRAGATTESVSETAEVPAIDNFISKEEKKLQKRKDKEEKKEKKKEEKRHKQIAKQLKNRNAANKRRKFLHFSWGMLFASLHHFIPRSRFLPGMTTLTGLTLGMELLRYRKGFEWMNNVLHFVLGKALRKNEMDGKFTGSLYYFSGVTLTSYLFPKSCATLGIVQLAVADPTASYFGRATRHVYWSRINNGFFGLGRNKGILGFLGGAVSCVPLNYRLLSLALVKNATEKISKPTVLAISFALGLAGAFADLIVPTPALTLPKKVCGVCVPPFHLDDNIVVPVISGWACVRILMAASIGPTDLTLAKYLVV